MKKFFKTIFLKIKAVLIKGFNMRKTLLVCSVSFVVFSLCFPAGALSNKTINENCAEYFAYIAKHHTIDAGQKKLSGLIVEPRDGTDKKMRHDTDTAINELWGVFKGENASFAPVINANKEEEIYFTDHSLSSESLSLVYTNIGQSAEPYHINKKTGEITDYKFQSSPLALMFPSSLSGMQEQLHIYISQKQAEKKLHVLGKDINKENLRSLINTPTEIAINGSTYSCVIDNIYLDNFEHEYKLPEKHNYYYGTDIGTIIGDFVYVILYAIHPGVFPTDVQLKRQSLYVMSEYSYRNKFFLEYAINSYPAEEYSFNYCKSNLKDGFSPQKSILEKTLESHPSNIWSVLITVFTICSVILLLFLVFKNKLFMQLLSIVGLFLFTILPYFLFKIIFQLSNNILLFSSYSLIFYLILIVIFALAIFVLNCFGRIIKVEKENV